MADSKNNFGKYLNDLEEINSYVSKGDLTPKQLGILFKKLKESQNRVLREAHRKRTLLELGYREALRDFDFIPPDSNNPFCRNYYCQGDCDIDTEALQKPVFLKNEEI